MKNRHPMFSRSSSRQHSAHAALLTAAVMAALAAPAPAQLQFGELPRRGLPAHNDPTSAIELGDVDGDGDLDLILGNLRQDRLYRNDGTGSFSDVTAMQMPVDSDGTRALALGDVDGDGDLDLVAAKQQSSLYLNDGSGTFTDVTAAQMPIGNQLYHSCVALGDVDGDGDLDLVMGRATNTDPSQLYLNDGNGTFTDVTAAQMPVESDHARGVSIGDVDGDGDLDIVIVNRGLDRLYVNDGSGTFSNVSAAQMPVTAFTDPTSVALGDVDGDGDLDMVIGHKTTSISPPPGLRNTLYLNNGSGTFTDVSATRMPDFGIGTNAVALGDIDGDADLDIAFVTGSWKYFGLGFPGLYLNDGTGCFSNASTTHVPADNARGFAVALGDVDGDGDLDMALGNHPSIQIPGQNRLYLNLQRQLHAPVDFRIGQTYTFDAYLRYVQPSPLTFALPYVSFAPASIALPPYGTIGIDPAQAIALPPIQIPQPAGVGSLGIAIVNDPGLLGTAIYSQALLVPYPYQARLSNVMSDVLIQ